MKPIMPRSSTRYAVSTLVLALLVAASPTQDATKQFTFSEITPDKNLTWFPCKELYFCAMLSVIRHLVPLDYSNVNGNQATVPLVKLAANVTSSTEPYKGMILTNPGGPGISGVDSVITYGGLLQSVIGSNFDIVAFDPRGIGSSIPLANCSVTPSKQHRSPEIAGPNFGSSFLATAIADATKLGQDCQAAIGGEETAGPHMTTATNARDMVSIANAFALTADGLKVSNASLVNYWGLSYGTIIGQTFASMFPELVGRFVIDGVVDTDDWLSGHYLHGVLHTDQAFASFFDFCNLAGPKNCSYYTGHSRDDIYNRFEKTFNFFDGAAAEAQNLTVAPLIETALEGLKSLLDESTYYPIAFFPILSDVLLSFEAATTNLSVDTLVNIQNQVTQRISTIKDVIVSLPALPEWAPAVACSDANTAARNISSSDLEVYFETLRNQSTINGELWAVSLIQCSKWTITSEDRFLGPYGAATKTPLLFVSNTVDPATPIVNGQKAVASYGGAKLLTIEGVGHTSLGTLNQCAFNKISTYFQTGALPSSDTPCPVEAGAFGVTLAQNATIAATGANSMSTTAATTVGSSTTSNVIPNQSTSVAYLLDIGCTQTLGALMVAVILLVV